MPLLENFAYGFSCPGPEPKLTHQTDEVTYLFLKGYGWVPETELSLNLKNKQERQAAKPANFGGIYDYNVAWDQIRTEWRAEVLERRTRELVDQYLHYDTPVAFRADHGWEEDAWPTYRQVPQIPRVTREQRGPHDPQPERRYFAGVGETEERREENIHERRLREYQEARRRFRGNR